jgi:hypothetical protein
MERTVLNLIIITLSLAVGTDIYKSLNHAADNNYDDDSTQCLLKK